jgi:uncharacterized protein YjbI with pentapeptide repeats
MMKTAKFMKPIEPGDGLPLRLMGAFIRRTDLTDANLEGADLSRADMSNAVARRANFKNAKLWKTILRGTNLADARNLTVQQLAEAIIDETTVLPEYIDRVAVIQAQRTVGAR